MSRKFVVICVLFFSTAFILSAHSGRTDKYGGHNGPNGYHYHNGKSSSTPPKTVAPAPVVPAEKFFILADESEKLYHKELCKTIEGKNVSEILRNTAVSSGYKACDVCKP